MKEAVLIGICVYCSLIDIGLILYLIKIVNEWKNELNRNE